MRRFRPWRRFVRAEKGAITAEYVIGFPVIFLMVMAILELSFLMMRSTMLQRGLDLTLREVRLGTIINPTVTALEQAVCSRISIFPDCETSLVLEFTEVNRTTFDMPGPSEPCTRRSVEFMQQRAAEIYDTGEADSLMVVRACVVVDTITPFLSDVFRLSARSAFGHEPRE